MNIEQKREAKRRETRKHEARKEESRKEEKTPAERIEVKNAERKHVYTITVLTKKYFSYTGFDANRVWERLNSEENNYFVAELNGYSVGFIDTEVKEGKGRILGFAVLDEFQGRGIGKKLLERALKHLKEKGVSEISLMVFEDNEKAIGLYEKYGFQNAGRIREIWGKPVILMKRENSGQKKEKEDEKKEKVDEKKGR